MNSFNFRNGPFLKIESPDNSKWVKYGYFPKEDRIETEDVEMGRREISGQISEHFEKAQYEAFKSRKIESDVRYSLSRASILYEDKELNVPYLWSNNILIVRQATTLDQRGVLNILAEAKKQSGSYALERYFKSIISKGLLIVVTDYKNIVRGIQTLHIRKDESKTKSILDASGCLYIEDMFRHKGSFRKIFDMVFEAAADAHCKTVFTKCSETNSVAEKYEHIGFTRLDQPIITNIDIDDKSVQINEIGFEKEIITRGHSTFF